MFVNGVFIMYTHGNDGGSTAATATTVGGVFLRIEHMLRSATSDIRRRHTFAFINTQQTDYNQLTLHRHRQYRRIAAHVIYAHLSLLKDDDCQRMKQKTKRRENVTENFHRNR